MSSPPAARSSKPLSVGVAIGLTIAALLGSLVVGAVYFVPVILLEYDIQSTNVLVGGMIATQIGFVGVGYLYVRSRRVAIPIERPTPRTLAYVVAGTIVALVVAAGMFTATGYLELQPESMLEDAAATDPTFLLALAALSVVLIAPVEEFLFRGLVQGRLREAFGPVGAIAGASLLFGSMHLLNYGGSIPQIVAGAFVIVCVGAVFGTLYEATDNLLVPILVHALYNVALMLSSYVAI